MSFNAKMILASMGPSGIPLYSVQATYPRFIHSEILTHRDRERNSASSRAIPWKRKGKNQKRVTDIAVNEVIVSINKDENNNEVCDYYIANCMYSMIKQNPVIPIKFGLEQPGMQTGDALSGDALEQAKKIWLEARDDALRHADRLAALGVHKSLCNRVTEPWMWITVIMTATEWNNFFRLRCHPAAEIHFQKIAGMIRDCINEVKASRSWQILGTGEWHLPYVTETEYEDVRRAQFYNFEDELIKWKKVSTGRCARVSYLTQEGKRELDEDVKLHDRLLKPPGDPDEDIMHACYDSETDVLTSNGWKNWTQVTGNEEFCTLNLNKCEIEYQKALNTNLGQKYNGLMISIDTNNLNLLVTPNHKMLVCLGTTILGRKRAFESYRLHEAQNLMNIRHAYLKAGHNQFIKNGSKSYNELALLGFALGDGYRVGDKLAFHLKKERKIKYLKSLVPSIQENAQDVFVMSYPFDFDIYDSFKFKYLDSEFLMHEDNYPIYEGLINSDGSIYGSHITFSNNSKKLIDAFCQICVHLSFGFSIRKQGDNYSVNVLINQIKPEINRDANCSTKMEYISNWSGKVYCVEVPNKTLYVRRNGIGVWSGNSPFGHIASASKDPTIRSGPFKGWNQYRKEFSNENVEGS